MVVCERSAVEVLAAVRGSSAEQPSVNGERRMSGGQRGWRWSSGVRTTVGRADLVSRRVGVAWRSWFDSGGPT